MADDPVEHVIVLMLENRSFDHVLAGCPKVKANHTPAGVNRYNGKTYRQVPGALRVVRDDPKHDTPDVLVQLQGLGDIKQNGRFVLDYAEHFPGLRKPGEVIEYHDNGTLPAIHALADAFTVCDQWYASVPGPTWANRLFAMSGTSLGRVKMPSGILDLNLHWYDQHTLFDRLNERNKDWRVYFGDAPLSFLLVHQWEPQNAVRHHHMTTFYRDAAGEAAKFPSFAWIEPAYLPPGANDGHPPYDILEADVLVANVYNAIRANEALWMSSLLIVLFDEHGGFYDHVAPPAASPPDHHNEEYSFDRYGVRVPAILVSPHVGNAVFPHLLDHTSTLRYLQDKWLLGDLGARTALASTFASVVGAIQPRTNTPIHLPATGLPARTPSAGAVEELSQHQKAILAMTHNLEAMSDEDPTVVAARSRQLLSGAQSQADVAVDRVERFISRRSRH